MVPMNPMYWNSGTINPGFFKTTYSLIPQEVFDDTKQLLLSRALLAECGCR